MASTIKLKHNKKRNTGLIYEFLIRKMSQSILDNDSKSYNFCFKTLKKYFSDGQPLHEENKLFNVVLTTQNVEGNKARRILDEVKNSAKALPYRLCDIKKSNLIKEIHQTFGRNFFSIYKINDYKAYASAQLLINCCNNKSKTIEENVDRVFLEEALIEYMSRSDNKLVNEAPQVDSVVYSIAVKKFNERYNDSLNGGQKKLLKEYITILSSQDEVAINKNLTTLLENQKKQLLNQIQNAYMVQEIVKDNVIKEKLAEVEQYIKSLDLNNQSQAVEDLMLTHKLVEEINSDE